MINTSALFATVLAWHCCAVQAAEFPAAQEGNSISQTQQVLSDAQERNFGKSVDFCDSLEPTDHKAIKSAFERYLSNFRSGTRSGLLEVNKTEPIDPPSPDLTQGPIVDMQVKQRDMLTKAAQTNPTVVCGKLLSLFMESSAQEFQQNIETSYRQYLKKRRDLCSQADRPQNCKQESSVTK
jgi:hypothetical protein